jgi:hypothetical protein
MLETILHFHERAAMVIKEGCPIVLLHELPVVNTLMRMKTVVTNDNLGEFDRIIETVDKQMDQLEAECQWPSR